MFSSKAYTQGYLNCFNDCDKIISNIDYIELYGEIEKHIYINCVLGGDTIFDIKAMSILGDTLRLAYFDLYDRINDVGWLYSWGKYYDTYFLSSLNKVDKNWNKGISKIYKLYREDQKSIYRFSDYTQTPEFDEYYNFGEKTIDTDIILTFPKFFKEIQGVKED